MGSTEFLLQPREENQTLALDRAFLAFGESDNRFWFLLQYTTSPLDVNAAHWTLQLPNSIANSTSL